MENKTDPQLDRLFREHLQRELPHPWPPLQLPAEVLAAERDSRSSVRRGRLVLAASLGILVVGLGLAAALLDEPARPVGTLPRGGSAKKPGAPPNTKPATTPDAPRPADDERKPFGSLISPRER